MAGDADDYRLFLAWAVSLEREGAPLQQARFDGLKEKFAESEE
jgi:hypothetical protein